MDVGSSAADVISAPLSPSARLVFLLARPNPPEDVETRARELLAEGATWTEAANLAALWEITPLFDDRAQRTCGDLIPSPAFEEMAFRRRNHLALCLFLQRERERIGEILTAAGVPFQTLKGAWLSEALYGDPALREYSDLDLLVDRSHLASAAQALERSGLTPKIPLPAYFELLRWMDSGNREIRFEEVRGVLTLVVELHWDVFPEPGPPLFNWNATDHAVYLVLHGAKHLWRPLKFIFDLRDWIQRWEGQFDWHQFWLTARRQRCGTAAAVGLLVARVLGGFSWPSVPGIPAISTSLERRLIAYALQSDAEEDLWRFHRLRAAMADTPAGRFRYRLALLKPSMTERERCPDGGFAPWILRIRRLCSRLLHI